jgi:hypothetical protein
MEFDVAPRVTPSVKGATRPKGDVREAAARAYDKYQSCGLNAARRLFR